jgi:signal transduction histidine kinase
MNPLHTPLARFPGATLSLTLALSLTFASTGAHANNASRDEAVAMVKKGVAFIKASGTEKAYAAFTEKNPQFIDRDLYLVVYGLDGKCLAHGANPKQVGKDLIDLTDIDGKYFVKDRVAMVKAKPAGAWQEYKFTNPVSKKIEPKVMYCEKLGETAVCGGVYP